MSKLSILLVLAALGACSAVPQQPVNAPSPCAAGESSYACQIERYQNVDV